MFHLRKVIPLVALLVAAGLAGLTSDSVVEATSFGVNSPVALVDSAQSSVSVPSPYAPGAAPDLETQFNIPAPHSNFQQVFNFGPIANQVTAGSAIATGAVLGRLTADTQLGLLNSPCNQFIAVSFVMLNSSTDNSAGNEIDPLDPTDPNPLAPMADDADSNGIADGIEQYPSYLNKMFDPDETANPFSGLQPLKPHARYMGSTVVANLDVVLNLLVFKPSDLQQFKALANHPFTQFVSGFGWATTVVLNDPTVPPAPSSITDFCTGLTTTTTLFGTSVDNECTPFNAAKLNCPNAPTTLPPSPTGGEGGSTRSTNGAAGSGILGTDTHLYGTYATGLRDADNDGKENQLDTCPLTADNMNPRTADAVNDTDSDGIANVCDESGAGGSDEDGDGWPNRQDNCPNDINNGEDAELVSPYPADGGPRADGIGDDCDANPTVGDGHYHVVYNLGPVCVKTSGGGAFYCPETLTALGAPGATPEHLALHSAFPSHDGAGKATPISPATGGPAQSCNDGVNNDGQGGTDGADDGCGSQDSDGDGFSDSAELNVGTDPRYACPTAGHASGDAGFAGNHDARPQEIFISSARVTDFQDLNALVPFLGQAKAFPTSNRLDLFPSASIDFQDMNSLVPYLGTGCSP